MAIVGMVTDTLLMSLLIGGILGWGFARFQGSKPDGYLQHLAYWYGVIPLKGRAVMNPFVRQVWPL